MRSPQLARWLKVLAEQGREHVVIVPGGGGFADHVRNAQRRSGFNDHSAHRLALLAMAQYGHLLLSLHAFLLPAVTLNDIRMAWRLKRTAIWLPLALINDESEVPASWDWSSDSIALWLAQKIDAALYLVKSQMPATASVTAEELARADVTDQAFPRLLRRQSCDVFWLGPNQQDLFTDFRSACRIESNRSIEHEHLRAVESVQ